MSQLLAAGGAFTPDDITRLFLAFAVLLGSARLLGELARLLRQPTILGEILAGVLLGPTLFGAMAPELYASLFPESGPVGLALEGLFILSAALLLLIAGLEVELSSVWKQGKAALLVSVFSMVVPFATGFGLAYAAPSMLGYEPNPTTPFIAFALFVGIALSITALPVIAKILLDLKLAKSDFGTIVVSSAMLNDLIGWMGFAMVLAMVSQAGADGYADPGEQNGASAVMTTILLTLLFIGAMLTLGTWAINRLLPYIQAHWSWPGGVLGFVMVLTMLGAAYTEWIGIHSIFGAFIVGVAIGDSRHLRNRTREMTHQFIGNVFAPLFFASIGLRVNFVEAFDLKLVVVVLVVAILGKLAGCYIGAIWAGQSKRESWAIGFAMCARGAMEIILGQLALATGLITEELFVAIVIMALVTSLMAGPAIELLLQRRQPRRLSYFMSERCFIPSLQADTARQAIAALSERAGEVADLDAKIIEEAVWAREMIVRTGIGHGVAIPHARLDGLSRPILVIGRDPEGLDFDAPDGELARFVCLILTPRDDPRSQLELLALVSRAFSQADTRIHALEAESYTELLAALSVVEEEA